jgi:hypothetical protein
VIKLPGKYSGTYLYDDSKIDADQHRRTTGR